ncbi:hypothetical protein FRZ03_09115 [Streptomyces misionensis]|uniref:Uncharacterized protein n=1 Tax=Streptomyces misionensis TaxID=67331 RepID=A0A5C6K014_9ACTN|nr:hypothetical protein FRZ03_09115 [Streptomyces misionensis]
MGTTKRTTSAAPLSTGRWPSDPDLTRRCRRHPPRLRLLTHTVQVVHSIAKAPCRQAVCVAGPRPGVGGDGPPRHAPARPEPWVA